jgi:hypothetical protein
MRCQPNKSYARLSLTNKKSKFRNRTEANQMLTDEKYKSLIDARLRHPESFKKALVNRRRRKMIGKDGRLLIVAADHTARGIIAASNDPFAIANRKSLLDRLMRSLSNPLVDGVLASAEIKTCFWHDESRRLPGFNLGA